MRIRTIACLALLALLAATSEPTHLRDARQLVAGIDHADNEYNHKLCFIHWKGEPGVDKYGNRTDCSEFLNLLLAHSYGISPDQLKDWTGHRRPDAAQWHDAVVAGKLKQIEHLSDARPGDVLAVKFPPGMNDTGHIMIVAGPITERDATAPLVDGTHQWDVPIIDSSGSGHGPKDTRRKPDGTVNTGVGSGTLRIYTQADGTIAGYSWSASSKSKFEARSERSMVIGRLILDAAR